MEEYLKKSRLTGQYYNLFDDSIIRILNPQQVAAYIEYGLMPIDIYTSKDEKTGKKVLVFLFDRQETKAAYDLWCKHEL